MLRMRRLFHTRHVYIIYISPFSHYEPIFSPMCVIKPPLCPINCSFFCNVFLLVSKSYNKVTSMDKSTCEFTVHWSTYRVGVPGVLGRSNLLRCTRWRCSSESVWWKVDGQWIHQSVEINEKGQDQIIRICRNLIENKKKRIRIQ